MSATEKLPSSIGEKHFTLQLPVMCFVSKLTRSINLIFRCIARLEGRKQDGESQVGHNDVIRIQTRTAVAVIPHTCSYNFSNIRK